MKGIKAAKTVGTLALGFLTLVETAYLFGIGKVRRELAVRTARAFSFFSRNEEFFFPIFTSSVAFCLGLG